MKRCPCAFTMMPWMCFFGTVKGSTMQAVSMRIASPPAPSPMRMPRPSSPSTARRILQRDSHGAWRATMSRLLMKPPAHSTTPPRARRQRSSPSMRATTPTTRRSASCDQRSPPACRRGSRAPDFAVASQSARISSPPASMPSCCAVWPRGAGLRDRGVARVQLAARPRQTVVGGDVRAVAVEAVLEAAPPVSTSQWKCVDAAVA